MVHRLTWQEIAERNETFIKQQEDKLPMGINAEMLSSLKDNLKQISDVLNSIADNYDYDAIKQITEQPKTETSTIPKLSLVPISFNVHQIKGNRCVPTTIHFENKQVTNTLNTINKKHVSDDVLSTGIDKLMNRHIGEISFTDVSCLSTNKPHLFKTLDFHFVITHDTSVWSKSNFKILLFELIRKVSFSNQHSFLINEGTPHLIDSIHITPGTMFNEPGVTPYSVKVSAYRPKTSMDKELIESATNWYDFSSGGLSSKPLETNESPSQLFHHLNSEVIPISRSSMGFITGEQSVTDDSINNVKAMRDALNRHKEPIVSSNLLFWPNNKPLPNVSMNSGITPNSIPGQPWDARHPAGAMPLRGEVMQEPNNTFGRLTRPQGTYISDQEIRIAKELYLAISQPFPNHKGLAIIEKALTYYAENRETITHVVVVLDLPHSLLLKHIKSFNQCILHVYTLETATEELLRDITGINIKPNHVFVDNSVIKMFRDHATRLLDSQL